MAPSEDVLQATREFLDEYPDAESALASLVDRDEESSWTFDDVELDSGRFGELVSREIVVKTDGGDYQLQDRTAVVAVLDGDSAAVATADDDDGLSFEFDLRSRVSEAVDRREIGGLLVALALVVGARLISYGSVMRGEYVVSPANDPYFYRYWQAQLLERSDGVTDFGVLSELGGASSRPLTHSVNWWLAELLGGTPAAADTVAAWLPIGGAVGGGIVVYLLTKLLTGDVRAAVAAVAFLAVAPVHIVYTQIGFLEHRLHQYLWLGILVLAIAWLAVDVARRFEQSGDGERAARGHMRSQVAWLVAGVVAIAVTASAHVWRGSALTFIPVAGYIALRVIVDVREEIPPLHANGPLLAGVSVGGVISVGLYSSLGWSETALAVVPLLVAVGGVTVAGVGELWRRRELRPRGLLAAQVVIAVIGLILFRVAQPEAVERLRNRADSLFFREGATETASLFTTELFVLLGPISQIGISYYLGLAALLAATWVVSQRYEPGWLVVVCFSWYYMLLSVFQVRFAAQLTVVLSVCAGVGCLSLLAKLELVRPIDAFSSATNSETSPSMSIPRGGPAIYLGVALLVLLAANFIYAPTLVGQTTHSDEQFEAALAIEEHATVTDRGYPESAVDAQWGDIRMYNYFVNGESHRYNSQYEQLLATDNPDEHADGFREGGKYVVINEFETASSRSYETLFEGLGVGYGNVSENTGQYQPIYIGDSYRAFTTVEGAVLKVSGAEGEMVTATANVEIDSETVTYERHGKIEDGEVRIRVAHSGEYTIDNQTVTVEESAVFEGDEIRV